MYAINIAPQNSQKCQSCQNTFIQYVGTQAWCFECKKAIKTIQQEVKVVPKMYQSNCKDKQSSAEIKIKNYLNEFCNKYGGVSDIEEMNFMYRQAIQLKNKKGMTTKNYRQNCASVVYVHFKDIHRLSIKEFCKKNQIDQKSFNKSYLIYQKFIKQKAHKKTSGHGSIYENQLKKQGSDEDLKFQYTNEQQSGSQLEGDDFRLSMVDYSRQDPRGVYSRELKLPGDRDTKFQQGNTAQIQCLNEPLKNTRLQRMSLNNLTLIHQSRSFLQVVFDSFFSSLFYKEKKSLLIKELSQRVVQAYKNFKEIIRSCDTSQFLTLQCSINESNFYKYLLYFVLRKVSHRISQLKYRKIIQDSTGQLIKCTVLKQMIKLFQSKQETVSFSGDSMFFIENSGTTGSEFVKIEEKQ